MKKTLGYLLLAAILVFSGCFYSSIRSSDAAMQKHYFRVCEVPSAELKFLKSLDSSLLLPPNFKSGAYVLEIQMPSGDLTRRTLKIQFYDNQFALSAPRSPGRIGFEESANIEGNVVSWHDEGILYDAGVKYVGLVSGSQMFGHVYNYDQGPNGEVGFWRLFPQHPVLDESVH